MIFGKRTSECLSSSVDQTSMEPVLARMLVAKELRWALGRYRARSLTEVEHGLHQLLAAHNISNPTVTNIRRLSGGSSKEQFAFELADGDGNSETLVLRMDPRGGIVETLRSREAEILNAMENLIPVPKVVFLDAEGCWTPQPSVVTSFVTGVTRPTQGPGGLSGLGTYFPPDLARSLAPHFLGCLATIHSTNYATLELPSYAFPEPGYQPALWQVNFWSRVWREDRTDTSPLLALTEAWLRDNLPVCDEPVLLHGDYRVGNFMFDEIGGNITAILDWELAHVGDFHEDLSYNLQPIFGGKTPDAMPVVAAMFSRDEYLHGYEEVSGRKINGDTLHFYDVLNTYKLTVLNHATGVRAADAGVNHQNCYLTYMAAIAHTLAADLPDLLKGKRR